MSIFQIKKNKTCIYIYIYFSYSKLKYFLQYNLLRRLYLDLCHGRGKAPFSQTFDGARFSWIFPIKAFWHRFFFLKNVIPQIPLSLIYQGCASFFWWTRYTPENEQLLGIYAVVNQVRLFPKEMISMCVA